MHDKHALLLLLVLLIFSIDAQFGRPAEGARQFYDKQYSTIDSYMECVLLLNESAKFGCTGTSCQGNTGLLYPIEYITEMSDVDNFVRTSETIRIVPLLFAKQYKYDILRKLNNDETYKGKIAGVLLASHNVSFDDFSPDIKFPNKNYGIQKELEYQWNPNGNGMLYDRFDFPILLLNAEQSQEYILKANANKQSNFAYPRYVAEFKYFMDASETSNTKECIDQRKCQPIGGNSVWTIFPSLESGKSQVVLSTSAMDSLGMFHTNAPGALSYSSAMIVQLMAAHSLHQAFLRQPALTETLVADILFTLFDAETFGYSGSQRFFEDAYNFTCSSFTDNKKGCTNPYSSNLAFTKLNILKRLQHVIEVGEIGAKNREAVSRLFIHKESTLASDNPVSNMVKKTANDLFADKLLVNDSSVGLLPPSSLHTLHFYKPSTNAILLADFDQYYRNRFFHSEFDTMNHVDLDALCDATMILSNTLYKLASQSSQNVITVNCTLLKELATCMMQNVNCPLMQSYTQQTFASSIPSHYSGVFQWQRMISKTSFFAYSFLASLTANYKDSSNNSCTYEEDCDANESCVLNQCTKTRAYYHDAISPAFAWDYVNWRWTVNNASVATSTRPKFSAFSESNWQVMGARIFLQDSLTTDIVVLISGFAVLVLSLVGFGMKFVVERKLKSQ